MLVSVRTKWSNKDKNVLALTSLVTGDIELIEWREWENWTELTLFRRLNLSNIIDPHSNDLSKRASPVSAETSLPLYSLCSNHNDLLSVPQPQKLCHSWSFSYTFPLPTMLSLTLSLQFTVFPQGSLS